MNKKILAVLLTVIIMLSAAIPVSAFKTDFFGDVDQNGEISSIDALLVLMHSVELKQITDIKIQRIADVNGDEKIDSSDALLILQKSVVLIDQLPMDEQASELINRILDDYNIESEIKDRFFSVFENEEYPIIQIIAEDNFDEILKSSKEMRNNIRGQDIGGLG